MLSVHIDSMSEIEDNHKYAEILCNTNFNELNVMNLLMNEQHDVAEELLGVAFAPTDNATGMMGMAPRDGRCWGYTCATGLKPFCHALAFVQDLVFVALAVLFTRGV